MDIPNILSPCYAVNKNTWWFLNLILTLLLHPPLPCACVTQNIHCYSDINTIWEGAMTHFFVLMMQGMEDMLHILSTQGLGT